MCLLGVPRATTRRSQAIHDLDQFEEPFTLARRLWSAHGLATGPLPGQLAAADAAAGAPDENASLGTTSNWVAFQAP